MLRTPLIIRVNRRIVAQRPLDAEEIP